MRLTRCHVNLPLVIGSEILLPELVTNHLLRVLRLCEGDTCVLFNGDGHDYSTRLIVKGRREARVRIEGVAEVCNESPLAITLVQAIARGEKMDLILQKATELGIAAIVPVDTERTGVRLDGERLAKRLAHWSKVVISACEQCGRARVPAVQMPHALQALRETLHPDTLRLILDPQSEHRLATLSRLTPSAVTIAIGPEGGWSPRDLEILKDAGFIGFGLGPRILRTETAGLAAIAVLQAQLGDL
ncbi:16S rRNA (uracil(1498)-N(3))-methyltransferase [Xylella taiwanensis]|uniref:Ribosomal RNA small subunit methyltransferase E n=1 Tax=Xylella taiwanensis TaxID=1444770 RepID=Z9JJV1_9GAMM|nr:16S rRNA (uracil(1498)-N(3))-methyltransferase [Xylella taiwanensis]AXI82626.1 16S rRNA methyltransferase [Xylella taiwanensis]EWS78273.1 16S rRNA methyltransferase [Xylella taiwanensis]MCD8455621.1 16S rRNA (uracil(1498)-N(3))-methyltransferase [Xylella taiwanensis]MCD8458028.1 16S rRNA (uracil(1498)-N(3))-methyltransferase [Xylella taiwanensis]MCD8460164.1 16S rRNA (uracil(1498)-N(3))-methyltransferase [Xylella taiwanensis]